jgi:hypothetical protein
MEWRRREASWLATEGDWTIELTPFVSKLWPNDTDSWVRKVHKAGSRKVRWMGAYQTLKGAKDWAERDLADPSAYFKTSWSRFEHEPYNDNDDDGQEEPNYG